MAGRISMALLLLLLLLVFTLAFLLRVKDEMADFEVNYTAAQRLSWGETLYRAGDGHWQFKYLPFSAFLYLPVCWLPLLTAKAFWYGIVILSSGLIFYLSFKLIQPDQKKAWVCAYFPPLILARYFLREIQLGQINALITLLLLIMVWKLAKPGENSLRHVTAGGFAGLATALKPYALIFFPYFIIRKKWLSLAGKCLVLVLALLAPSLFYGLKGNFEVLREWRTSLAASTPSLFSSQDNVSLTGMLVKWTGRQDLSLILYVCLLLLLGCLAFWLFLKGRKIPRAVLLDCFLLLALIPLISPLGWDYTLLSSAPAVMLVLKHFDKYPRFWRFFLAFNCAAIALSLYDLMGRELYAAFMSLSIITINFLILTGYLVYLRIKEYA